MRQLDFNIFETDVPVIKPSKGRILIAEPFLKGPYFSRSIVLLTEYSKQGAVGFVLNKSSNVYPDEVIDDLFSFKGELFIGGPVASDTLHFIHTIGEALPGAVRVTENIFWGGDFDRLKEMINNDEATFKQVKFFAGYSGWSPGQLENEIKEKSWIVAELGDKVIMESGVEDIWEDTLKNLGGVYKTWSKFPNDPTRN
ncbi:YqgE/AlgH family protein [Plebeiibacterium marinum]|uniref:YqgE/AlgH family protein n=1 Tax=Plebeiibacterium marinum TaxID=2992111 RepID=A0AAE3MCF0_9BACT|nr:YqgE/AlgH family protein [Plebeiobacterium marinum]MCW3805024.1 YqgE/AlgH family protein [Plebeiobacterium marinum]